MLHPLSDGFPRKMLPFKTFRWLVFHGGTKYKMEIQNGQDESGMRIGTNFKEENISFLKGSEFEWEIFVHFDTYHKGADLSKPKTFQACDKWQNKFETWPSFQMDKIGPRRC